MSQQINLYNPAFATRRGGLDAITMAWGFGAAVLLLAAIYGYAAVGVAGLESRVRATASQLERERGRLEEIAKTASSRKKNQELESEIMRVEAQVATRQRIMDTLRSGAFGNTDGYSEYLRAFARQIVEGLWLTGFSIVGAGADMAIHGKALQPDIVPAYLRRLNGERIMQGRAFAGMRIRPPPPAAADSREKTGKPAQPAVIEFSLFSAGAADGPHM